MKPFDIDMYLSKLVDAMRSEFGAQLSYIGLQGSYLRGEATEHSDIDVMVVLQELTTQAMEQYRSILEQMGDTDRACGFICSVKDLKNWNPLEACQLKHTTKDLYGSLAPLLPAWTIEDEVNYIKLSLNNLYHAICHSYIHGDREKLERNLPAYYKFAFFILQNTHYLDTYRAEERETEFVLSKADLLNRLKGDDRIILQTFIRMKNGEAVDFCKEYQALLSWCQNKMAEIT